MRFIQNLLPLLESPDNPGPSRVVSVLGGGLESRIDRQDLDLKRSYSVLRCAGHAITMTSLSMEHLAAVHTSVGFLHVFPWLVGGTNIYRNSFPAPVVQFVNYIVWPLLMRPFAVDLAESGERNLFHSTSAWYPSRDKGQKTNQGVPIPKGELEGVAIGSNGEPGSGAYLLNWKGEGRAGGKTMRRYREEGMPGTVWKHTVELLDGTVKR